MFEFVVTGNKTRRYWRQWLINATMHWDLIVKNYDTDWFTENPHTRPIIQYVTKSGTKQIVAIPKSWCVLL